MYVRHVDAVKGMGFTALSLEKKGGGRKRKERRPILPLPKGGGFRNIQRYVEYAKTVSVRFD
jgi:hypothetical protein